MPNYDDEVVVLRSRDYGEADRILTCFGRAHGTIRALARGVRRTSSKIGARVAPGNVIDAQFFTRGHGVGSLDTLTQAVTVHSFAAKMVEDWDAYAAASAVLEAAERILEAEPAPDQFAQLVGTLHDLAHRAHPTELLLDSYLLRALALAGWEPDFVRCVRCGKPGPHEYLSVSAGGTLCPEDIRAAGALLTVDVATLRLLWALLVRNWRVAEMSAADARTAARKVIAAYTQYHLERGLRSVQVYEQEVRFRGHVP